MQVPNNELIFGLVAPLGVDLQQATNSLESVLIECGYTPLPISLSKFINDDLTLTEETIPSPEDEFDNYIFKMQSLGNSLRAKLTRNDAMAMCALRKIYQLREEYKKSNAENTRLAFIIRQLKTPDEVDLLRKVYGERFILIGIYASIADRVTWLSKAIARSRDKSDLAYTKHEQTAKELIHTDDADNNDFGQNVRHTFPKSDYFANWAGNTTEQHDPQYKNKFETQIKRFIHLLLGKPVCPPSNEEFLMFQAVSVSLRSGDWSRQVGAVIANREGSVIAVGRNDDPVVGGGVTASVSVTEENDPSMAFKRETVNEIISKLDDWLKPEVASLETRALSQNAMQKLKSTKLMGFGEFGRMVHAEMAAITDAALRGVPIKDQIMFCTTFPCQNCAKHLMAAGIRALVHIDPYPKSLVLDMYRDEVIQHHMYSMDSEEFNNLLKGPKPKFYLLNYLGVAPRRYEQLFKMPVRRNSKGDRLEWNPKESQPRINSTLTSLEYHEWELIESEPLQPWLKQ